MMDDQQGRKIEKRVKIATLKAVPTEDGTRDQLVSPKDTDNYEHHSVSILHIVTERPSSADVRK
jgi:hypothetical protein